MSYSYYDCYYDSCGSYAPRNICGSNRTCNLYSFNSFNGSNNSSGPGGFDARVEPLPAVKAKGEGTYGLGGTVDVLFESVQPKGEIRTERSTSCMDWNSSLTHWRGLTEEFGGDRSGESRVEESRGWRETDYSAAPGITKFRQSQIVLREPVQSFRPIDGGSSIEEKDPNLYRGRGTSARFDGGSLWMGVADSLASRPQNVGRGVYSGGHQFGDSVPSQSSIGSKGTMVEKWAAGRDERLSAGSDVPDVCSSSARYSTGSIIRPTARLPPILKPGYFSAGHTEPIEPIGPVKPVKPVKPIEPIEPIEPVKPIGPVEPTEPMETIELAEPTESTESTEPMVQQTARPSSLLSHFPVKAAGHVRSDSPLPDNAFGLKQNEQPDGGEGDGALRSFLLPSLSRRYAFSFCGGSPKRSFQSSSDSASSRAPSALNDSGALEFCQLNSLSRFSRFAATSTSSHSSLCPIAEKSPDVVYKPDSKNFQGFSGQNNASSLTGQIDQLISLLRKSNEVETAGHCDEESFGETTCSLAEDLFERNSPDDDRASLDGILNNIFENCNDIITTNRLMSDRTMVLLRAYKQVVDECYEEHCDLMEESLSDRASLEADSKAPEKKERVLCNEVDVNTILSLYLNSEFHEKNDASCVEQPAKSSEEGKLDPASNEPRELEKPPKCVSPNQQDVALNLVKPNHRVSWNCGRLPTLPSQPSRTQTDVSFSAKPPSTSFHKKTETATDPRCLRHSSSEAFRPPHRSEENVVKRWIRHFKSAVFGKFKYSPDVFVLSSPSDYYPDPNNKWTQMTLVLDRNFLRVISMHPDNVEQLVYEHLYMLYCFICKLKQQPPPRTAYPQFQSSGSGMSKLGYKQDAQALGNEVYHPLGERLYSFFANWSEPLGSADEVKPAMLSRASELFKDEAESFSRSLLTYYATMLPSMSPRVSKGLHLDSEKFFNSVKWAVEEVFWMALYERFFELVKRVYILEDMVYEQMLDKCASIGLQELGVSKALWLEDKKPTNQNTATDTPADAATNAAAVTAAVGKILSAGIENHRKKCKSVSLIGGDECLPCPSCAPQVLAKDQSKSIPYSEPIYQLCRLPSLFTPLSKLACLVECFNLIHRSVSNYYASSKTTCPTLTSDDVIPIFLFVLIHSCVPHFHSECAFMELFITEAQARGQEGYSLATAQAALSLLDNLRNN
ncbi:uncharacterized protein LOC126316991 [Schistocerca gregaria]|uniref:uncharacterized protein LOC126316991 n=1 Tax=Schistocerca gregaria TaxID=7010 RepID=UPI00211ECF28|nr:uncharacterized protein LOC126316991 [Schistocerca gregaria]